MPGRRWAAGILAFACLTFGAASNAFAAQRYASPTGSGSTCSQASPCPIQIAANDANPGDEVIVTPGDYSPPASVAPSANVYIHGVQGQPMPRIHFTAGFLWITNPGDRASYLALDAVTSAPIETSNGGSADQIIAHVTGANAQACYVYGTLTDSVCWASGTGGRGIEAQTGVTTTITVRNVTAVGTGSGGTGIRIQSESPGNLTANLTNVIARGAGSDINLTNISGSTLVANIDHTNHAGINPGGATVNETSQKTADPIFVNPAAGDFSEAPGSPTINAGVSSPLNGPFDVLGRPRTINGLTDIGAYEYDPFSGVALRNQHTRLKKRKAKVAVGCPAGTPTSCVGSIMLTFGRKTAGSTGFSIPAGAVTFLKVKVSKKTRRKVRKKRKLATTATASAIDGAGTRATVTARVKLKV